MQEEVGIDCLRLPLGYCVPLSILSVADISKIVKVFDLHKDGGAGDQGLLASRLKAPPEGFRGLPLTVSYYTMTYYLTVKLKISEDLSDI